MTQTLRAVALVAVVVGVGMLAYALGSPTTPTTSDASRTGLTTGTEPVARPALGSPDAPLVIAEYSDYLCPFCHRYSTEVAPELIERYVETGLVRFEWHDFPARGEASIDAAVAARAAGRQEAYWSYHDVLFERQEELRYSRDELVAIADDLGLDLDRFQADLDDPALEAAVLDDLAAAQRLGVRGTPSFLIGDRPLVGAQAASVFIEAIEAELAERDGA